MKRSLLAIPVAAAAAFGGSQLLSTGTEVPPEPVVPFTDIDRSDGWFDESWSPGATSSDPFDPSGVLGAITDPGPATDPTEVDAADPGSESAAVVAPSSPAVPVTTTTVEVLTIDPNGADVPEIDDLPDDADDDLPGEDDDLLDDER